jgi:hypothetical protein
MRAHVIMALIFLVSQLTVGLAETAINTPILSPTDPGSLHRVPGHYAIWLQTGAWNSTTEIKNKRLGLRGKLPADFDDTYQQAARLAFQSAIESVTFTDGILQPEEIKRQNYDAQIIVYQGSLKGALGAILGFGWSQTDEAEVNIDAIVAVIGHEGLKTQETVKGHGYHSIKWSWNGPKSDERLKLASDIAIEDLSLNSVNAAKRIIMNGNPKTDSALPSKGLY